MPGLIPRTSVHCFQAALLFLIIDRIPHEAVWTEWLKQLEDVVPANYLCDEEILSCFEGLMPMTRSSVYDAQPYITLYVHPVPQFQGFPKGSIFYRREIAAAHRVQVSSLRTPCLMHMTCCTPPAWRTVHCDKDQGW